MNKLLLSVLCFVSMNCFAGQWDTFKIVDPITDVVTHIIQSSDFKLSVFCDRESPMRESPMLVMWYLNKGAAAPGTRATITIRVDDNKPLTFDTQFYSRKTGFLDDATDDELLNQLSKGQKAAFRVSSANGNFTRTNIDLTGFTVRLNQLKKDCSK